jgi:hypothetical protein
MTATLTHIDEARKVPAPIAFALRRENQQRAKVDPAPGNSAPAAHNSDETSRGPQPVIAPSRRTRQGAEFDPTPSLVARPAPNSRQAKSPVITNLSPPGGLDDQQAMAASAPKIATPADAGSNGGSADENADTQVVPALSLFDPLLSTLASGLDDVEKTKNQQGNRYRQLTRTAVDKDGEERGFGLDDSHPAVAAIAAQIDALEALNKAMTKALERQLKQHPLWPWFEAQRGVGPKSAARLLHAIRDPYWNDLHDRPRTVSELWAFCGLHTLPTGQILLEAQIGIAGGSQTPASQASSDNHPMPAGGSNSAGSDHSRRGAHSAFVAARRQRGQKSNWSTIAKTRAWLIVEACMKQIDPACKTDTGIGNHLDDCGCSPYRVVVDERRQHTAVTHPDWTAGHSLNDGMRIASKELLKDLWREAKRIYETGDAS